MKRILAIAIAVSAVSIFANQTEAQTNGYKFGVGIHQSHSQFHHPFHGFGFQLNRPFLGNRFHDRIEQPPFFAKFPPVYYNEIVPRNYGVSPFAAPAGIMPVEGIGKVDNGKATRIINEYYSKDKTGGDSKQKTRTKSSLKNLDARRVINPYFTQRIADK